MRLLSAAERRFPSRAVKHEAMRGALASTIEFLEGILDLLVPHLDPRTLLATATHPPADGSAYGARKLLGLLKRDFGGDPAAELEIATLRAAVLAHLRAAGASDEPILVLGCGVGRLAEDLAREGTEVFAIDLATPLLLAAELLRKSPHRLWEYQTRNVRKAHDGLRRFEVDRVDRGQAHASYAIADATCTPFFAGSWPTIVSVYFTDVVPLSRLLPEIWRLLPKGGRFIHVGPLGYHFDDPAEHLAADELIDLFRFSGFDVGEPHFVPSTHQATSGSLYEARFENLVFTARKAAEHFQIDRPEPPFCMPPRSKAAAL